MEGAGQRDVVLRPLTRKPVVYAGLIVKNEERDLPRCLASLAGVVDTAVIVDTGSTDATLAVAPTSGLPVFTQVYTGASRQDATGDWKLWDFGKARNVFVDEIERRGADFVLWMDADDELLTPANLRRALYWGEYDVFGVQIESGGQRWTHHRLWRAGRGIRFEGRCHEYPTIGGHRSLELMDSVIRHDAAPGAGESSNQRNLRILAEEFAERPTPRTAFYLATTHRDGGRWREAADMFARRIAMGEGFRDEWLFAYLYRARCERAAGRCDRSRTRRCLRQQVASAAGPSSGWSSHTSRTTSVGTRMRSATRCKRPTRRCRRRSCGARATNTPTSQRGSSHGATSIWATSLRARSGRSGRASASAHADAEWDARIRSLEAAHRPVSHPTRGPAIALHRPGAIGDIMMTLNCVPAAARRASGPRDPLLLRAGDRGSARRPHARGGSRRRRRLQWLHRRASDHYTRTINLIGYPLHEGYPERPMRRHLLQYFAAEMGLPSEALPELTVPRPARPAGLPARYATLQAQAGWSVYKNWPRARWESLLGACRDIPVFQLGTADEAPIAGARHDFLGTPLSTAVALVANATLHIGVDSFANHLTHYRWRGDDGALSRTRGVIVWGSTQASAAGYPHNVNISIGLPCQPCFREDPKLSRMPRGPCITPPGQTYDAPRHACMHGLPVERVLSEVRRAWDAAAQPPESLASIPSR